MCGAALCAGWLVVDCVGLFAVAKLFLLSSLCYVGHGLFVALTWGSKGYERTATANVQGVADFQRSMGVLSGPSLTSLMMGSSSKYAFFFMWSSLRYLFAWLEIFVGALKCFGGALWRLQTLSQSYSFSLSMPWASWEPNHGQFKLMRMHRWAASKPFDASWCSHQN